MTQQEFYAKYKDIKVMFSSYYKYTFTFTATLPDGKVLSCGIGGSSEDIYRREVESGHEYTVGELFPYVGSVFFNGTCLEDFYDL